MGWKRNLRTVSSMSRSSAREAQKTKRQYERKQRLEEKLGLIRGAELEVEAYEDSLSRIRSAHKVAIESKNWEAMAGASEPSQSAPSVKNQSKIRLKINNLKPNWFTKSFGIYQKKLDLLHKQLKQAEQVDDMDDISAEEEYKNAYNNWRMVTTLAKRITSGDVLAFGEVLASVDLFSDIQALGGVVCVDFQDSKTALVSFDAHDSDMLLTETKSLLASGKLSTKKLSTTKSNEFYQDYVCSCTLAIARRLFAFLPLEACFITVIGEILDTKTGHIEDTPILSAFIPKQTFDRINLNHLDPSDSMDNFVHVMKFNKTKGFVGIEPLDMTSIDRPA